MQSVNVRPNNALQPTVLPPSVSVKLCKVGLGGKPAAELGRWASGSFVDE